jgi:two-component system sensor histidine kinase VicK
MLVSGTFIILRIRLQEFARLETELSEFSSLAIGEIFTGADKTEDDYAAALSGLVKTNGGRVEAELLSGEGASLDPEKQGTVYKNAAVVGAMAGHSATGGGSLSRGRLDYAAPYMERGAVRYIVYSQVSTQTVLDRLSSVVMTLAIALALAMCLTGVMGAFLARTITAPLTLLTKRVREWARGSFEHKPVLQSPDEIGQLARTFNEMSRELSNTLKRVTTEKNKMEILLYNMTDGVLAYDSHGVLIEANYSAQEQLELKNLRTLTLFEVLEIFGLEARDMSGLDGCADATVAIGEKYINLIFSPYYEEDAENGESLEGLVLVLQDVTKHKKLDDMRKEFVANVSHEIRTPLTTIKTYTETLLDGALEDTELARSFLTVVDKEADRMTVLARDLLILSRFDNNSSDLTIKPADLNEIIESSITQTEVLAAKKNQTIHYAPPGKAHIINADSARINQVIVNILSNAIKYSHDDTNIYITQEKSDKYYRLYIKDEGVGIPKDDLQRIFERFYRVDKARSREMGGTGLGLSIAKEIMEAHGFHISAASEPGKGATMILRFNRV